MLRFLPIFGGGRRGVGSVSLTLEGFGVFIATAVTAEVIQVVFDMFFLYLSWYS